MVVSNGAGKALAVSWSALIMLLHVFSRAPVCVCVPHTGPAAVPARGEVHPEGHWRLQPVQEDVVPAQPARQELHNLGLPCAALQVGTGHRGAASRAVSLVDCHLVTMVAGRTLLWQHCYLPVSPCTRSAKCPVHCLHTPLVCQVPDECVP
jgi:hypothetical protein